MASPESSALRVIDANLNRIGEGLRILEDLARQLLRREHLVEEDFIRLAGKAVEAWLREQTASSEPHFNGKDTVVLDSAWYPGGPSGEPLLLDNPYYFYVEVEGPAPAQPAWWLEEKKKDE